MAKKKNQAAEPTKFNAVTALINGNDKKVERFKRYQEIVGQILPTPTLRGYERSAQTRALPPRASKVIVDKFGIGLAKRTPIVIAPAPFHCLFKPRCSSG